METLMVVFAAVSWILVLLFIVIWLLRNDVDNEMFFKSTVPLVLFGMLSLMFVIVSKL